MKNKKIIIPIIIVLIILLLILVYVFVNNKDKILGSWEYEKGGFTYTFNKDNTGLYVAVGKEYKFTYKVISRKKIEIKYEKSKKVLKTDYSIKKNKLYLKDSYGANNVYIKTK